MLLRTVNHLFLWAIYIMAMLVITRLGNPAITGENGGWVMENLRQFFRPKTTLVSSKLTANGAWVWLTIMIPNFHD